MTQHILAPATEQVQFWKVPASLAIEVGDLMYDSGSGVAKPAGSQADKGSEALNQAEFARKFIGLSNGQRLSTQTDTPTTFPIVTDTLVELPCVSGTFEIGDLLGADEVASGDALEPQQVKAVTSRHLAIAVVVKRYASATTKVWCRLRSTYSEINDRLKTFLGVLQDTDKNVETLAANKTLVVSDVPIQVLDPGGAARDVTFPTEAQSKGLVFIVHNAADAAEVITCKGSGGAAFCTPTQNESALCYCDGTTWRGIVGANN